MMRQKHDRRLYDERQLRLAEEIVSAVKAALIATDLADTDVEALTGEIAFSVAAIVDGSVHMETEDDYLVPILGFAEGRMRDRLLVPADGGSSLHGLIPGCMSGVFNTLDAN